jgi:hypothetical protein
MKQILMGALAVSAMLAGLSVQAQTCNDQIVNHVPTSRYQLNSDGTALDLRTGLVWMRCSLGQKWDADSKRCTDKAKGYSWQSALKTAQSFDEDGGFAGHDDWRVPNLRELTSIESFHCSDPAINLEAFPNTPAVAFWSSTPLETFTEAAWALDFGTSHVKQLDMQDAYAIRLVRAGAWPNKIPPPSTAPAPVSSSGPGSASEAARIVE